MGRNSKAIAVPALIVALAASGCVPSVHPIYTEKDIVFDEGLIGVWAEPGSDETWAFTRLEGSENAYRLLYTDEDAKAGAFVTHLVKVRNHYFLDLFPEEPELASNDFYKQHLFPMHTFMHVVQLAPKLQLRVVEPEWLEEYLRKHPRALEHEIAGDSLLLTASTRDLQAFHIKHLKTEGAYGDPSEPMDRIDPPGAGS